MTDEKQELKLYSLPAEQAIIGSLLMNNNFYYRVNELINETHFYEPIHARLYRAIEDNINNSIVADPITLKKQFDDDKDLQTLGGAAYLVRLTNIVPNSINLQSYARTVLDFARRRGLLEQICELQDNIYDSTVDIQETIANVQTSLCQLEQSTLCDQSSHKIDDVLNSVIKDLDDITSGKKKLNLLCTGFTDLDSRLGGFGDTELIIVAGRPGMGKTSLALHHIYHGAKELQKQDKSVAFFSLEMGKEQIVHKLLSIETGVQASRMRTGEINPEELRRISNQGRRLPKNIFIDETGSLHINLLRARCKALNRKHNLGLIVVDYLQLIKGTNSMNKVAEITEISSLLKTMAKENNCPVLALSQLSRNVESRTDKRPILSDLRDSGSIEQDADTVIFLYREEYYLKNQEPDYHVDPEKYRMWEDMMSKVNGHANLNICKFRHGAVGNISVRFDGETTRFSDCPDN